MGVVDFMIDAASRSEPFFVLGAQRSGTTMLRLMLNNRPSLAAPHETVFITQFFRKLRTYGDLEKLDTLEYFGYEPATLNPPS